jgi:ribosomal protein L37AE/L43A
MSRALGIPPHHSRLKMDDGSPDCDYCSRSGGTMSAVKRDGVTVYICHLCQNQGADRNPPPQVARETVVAAPTGEPAIPMKPLRQAGKTFDKDPLAGLGELGMPKK